MIKLFELRKEKNLSQREVAKMLSISQGTYNNWENGKTEPSIDGLILISKTFGVSVDYLIDYDSEKFETKNKSKLESFYRNVQKLDEDELLSISKIVERLVSKKK